MATQEGMSIQNDDGDTTVHVNAAVGAGDIGVHIENPGNDVGGTELITLNVNAGGAITLYLRQEVSSIAGPPVITV